MTSLLTYCYDRLSVGNVAKFSENSDKKAVGISIEATSYTTTQLSWST